MKKALLFILTCFLTYEINAQQWVQLANIPDNLGFHHPVTFGIGDFGYLTTGTIGSGANQVSKLMFKYNPDTDTWTKMNDFPGTSRSFAIGAEYNGKGYLGFGLSLSQFLNDIWEFDPVTETWAPLTTCPCEARRHPAFIIRDGKIYVGLGDGPSGNLNDWWIYDINSDTWTQQANLPGPVRHHPFMFKAGDHVYAGMGHGAGIYKDWYEFDVVSNSWTVMSSFPGEARVAGTQFDYGGYGYVLSGDGDNHSFMTTGEFWKYDPQNDSWEALTPHPGISRWAPNSFVIKNKVYFTSGENRTNGVLYGDLWSYQLEEATSVAEKELNNQFSFYPNPANSHIIFESPTIQEVVVFDITGKEVLRKNGLPNHIVNIEMLLDGVYFVQVMDVHKTKQTFKLIKN